MNELGGSIEDKSKIEGILLLKQQEAEKKQKLLDAFDLRAQDKTRTKELVDEIDERIALLNADRYSLNRERRRFYLRLKRIKSCSTPMKPSDYSRKREFSLRIKSRRISSN
jgi:uncharacterized protein YydD (DUF2326 family)